MQPTIRLPITTLLFFTGAIEEPYYSGGLREGTTESPTVPESRSTRPMAARHAFGFAIFLLIGTEIAPAQQPGQARTSVSRIRLATSGRPCC
jgi:hypothetical protein